MSAVETISVPAPAIIPGSGEGEGGGGETTPGPGDDGSETESSESESGSEGSGGEGGEGGEGGDPIVLDLHKTGIVTTSAQNSNVYFDLSADGYKNSVGWIGTQDAFLFYDPTGQGALTSAKQLNLTNYV